MLEDGERCAWPRMSGCSGLCAGNGKAPAGGGSQLLVKTNPSKAQCNFLNKWRVAWPWGPKEGDLPTPERARERQAS